VTTFDRPSRITLLGQPIDRVTSAQALDRIFSDLDAGRGGWVVTPNLDILRRLVRDAEFHRLCAGADLMLADGMPLVWASRVKGTPLPERVAGSDLIWSLARRAAERGRSLFLLGGNPGAAEGAARVLRDKDPGLRIAGIECPAMGFERDETYMRGLEGRLVESRPDIVLVALGSPKQELVTKALRPHLPTAWFLGVGVTFSFVTGDVRRAPRWLQRLGLEWTHRLLQEPRRLWRRYLVDGVPFALRLLAASAHERLTGAGGHHAQRGAAP
jgi:N-acetylglucosaminyldiphosphoundecaprenol N-acetyl-beta-D-mannosaminyltransferase